MRVSETATGPGTFEAPITVSVIAPAMLLPTGNPGTAATLIDKVADPLPDGGLTCSHGWFDTAVHVTNPVPVCVSRTTCAAVCETNVVPVVTAPNWRPVLSSASRRGGRS